MSFNNNFKCSLVHLVLLRTLDEQTSNTLQLMLTGVPGWNSLTS